MARKLLEVTTTPEGCYVATSHKLNSDGYFRKRWSDGTIEFFHRTMWRAKRGEIPAGCEIDHLCRNRACFNVEHLRTIGVSEHKAHTNSYRYADRKEEARAWWLMERTTGTALGERFGVSESTGCRWVREWTRECH